MNIVDMMWDLDAWYAYEATKTTNPRLHAELTTRLAELAEDHKRESLRRHRSHRPPVWRIPVKDDDEDWAILWNEVDNEPAVLYVGLDPF